MKTTLPAKISTVKEAKIFLFDLHENSESFHPEDDAHTIVWDDIPRQEDEPTHDEAEQLNKLMADIYNLPGNDGRHSGEMIFDPCQFLLDLDKKFLWKDLSGRSGKGKFTLAELKEWDEVKETEELSEWLDNAEEGDEYQLPNMKFIRIN